MSEQPPSRAGWQPKRKPQQTPAPQTAAEAAEAPEVAEPVDGPELAQTTEAATRGSAGVPELAREPDTIERVAGLAAVAASAGVHAGGWWISQSLKASKRVAGAMTSPTKAVALADDVVKTTRDVLSTLIDASSSQSGPVDAARAAAGAAAAAAAGAVSKNPAHTERPADLGASVGGPELLRRAGDSLLRRSRELDEQTTIHPAYQRILTELAPDEGRVLRLMLLGGPQPSVDVRGGGILGFFNTHVVKRGLTMIGARAGLRNAEELPSYLNNLFRLGLIWISPETIRDYQRYQVLEAQPEVADAMHSVRHARVVRRSVHLTPFGEDFARTTFGTELKHQLPEHAEPQTSAAQPPVPGPDPFA
jgi:Abortive infection alpha